MQTPWLYAFLKDPAKLRHTTVLRMPQFNMSDKDAATLADYITVALQHPAANPASVDSKDLTPARAALGPALQMARGLQVPLVLVQAVQPASVPDVDSSVAYQLGETDAHESVYSAAKEARSAGLEAVEGGGVMPLRLAATAAGSDAGDGSTGTNAERRSNGEPLAVCCHGLLKSRAASPSCSVACCPAVRHCCFAACPCCWTCSPA